MIHCKRLCEKQIEFVNILKQKSKAKTKDSC